MNLILRPLEQPPFDFPYVEYFIYRNIEASSVVSAGDLDLAKEGSSPSQNDLIAFIRAKVLKRAAPESGTEAGKYIGLDRAHDPAPSAKGGVFGDAKPIDHLFRYPAGAELPIVEAGWKLGEFVGASFGFEVVVQMYGAQPKLGWARQGATALIEADTVATNATADEKYRSRLARETIGCFADPCAFWGMFFHSGLYFRSPATNDDNKSLKGKPLCDKLFFANGPFINRDRFYLNLRNETGYSYNFYRNYEDPSEDSLQIGPDAGNLLKKKYGVDGWPIHIEEALPGNKFCFRLCVDSPSPLLFLHQIGSNSPGGKRFTDKSDLLEATDPGWTKPIIFTRPTDSAGSRPPWCFVAHYLRGQDGPNVSTSPIGVFDTAPLQFGPIGDRVVSAYNELWPASVTTASPSTKNYERIFVSDKVFRYDGGSKSDPVDSTIPARSLAYDRVGDTYYIFQKGTATATAGKDSVIILQRRQYERRRDFIGAWNALQPVKLLEANQGLLFKLLAGKGLSQPIAKALNVGSGPPVTVLTFDELQSDTAAKKELFDFTFLCLSKAAFAPVVAAANPTSPNPAIGEIHAVFLTLTAPTAPPAQYSTYDVAWNGWDKGNMVFPPTGTSTPIYSADGVFFSSSDYDTGSLVDLASAYTMTQEEEDLSQVWDQVIGKDQMGSIESERMRALVDGFGLAILEVSPIGQNPKSALLALVNTYATQIWDRAVLLVQDTTTADSREWSDRILYCARAQMEVALKNHEYVRTNPADGQELVKRFEELSRNYAGLDFTGADKSKGEKAVILTGFDPFWDKNSGLLVSNPSGALSLYLAQSPFHQYTKAASNFRQLYIKTCMFPNRYEDFDKGIVEDTVDAALNRPPPNDTISLICTCSHDGGIKPWIDSKSDSVDRFHLRIDRFSARCRGGRPDSNKKVSSDVAAGTLPEPTNKKNFYETAFFMGNLSRYDASGTVTNAPGLKLRYNEASWYNLFPPKIAANSFNNHYVMYGTEYFPDGDLIFNSGHNLPISSFPLPLSETAKTNVVAGSGGQYLSNEVFYRVSNLIQSFYLTRTDLQARYAGVKNGHIHMPSLNTYADATRDKSLEQLVESVLAVLDGVLGL